MKVDQQRRAARSGGTRRPVPGRRRSRPVVVAVAVVVVIATVGAAAVVASLIDRDPGPSASTERAACTRLAGSARARLSACLDELGTIRLSDGAARLAADIVDDGTSKLLVAGQPLAIEGRQVELADAPALQAALRDDDEERAARVLRADGFRGVALHRDLTRALDRDDSVIARLSNHDFLEWFQLRWVTENGLIYTVRESRMRLQDSTGAELVAGLRARLAGTTPPRQSWDPSTVRLLGAIRLTGQSLVVRHAVGNDLERVLDELADKMRRRWEREVETLGVGSLPERLPDARIEVHVVLERSPVDPRDAATLASLWQLGIDGATLTEDLGDAERFAYLPGSEATARSLTSADSFLRYLADSQGFTDARPWERARVELTMLRGDEFMEPHPGGGAAVRMVRGMPPVSLDEVTDDNVRQMLLDGADWWVRNQRPDNSFVYKYWPDQNRFSSDYNEVRHILAARDLAVAYRYRPDPRYLDGARRAMDWLLQYEITPEDPPVGDMPQPGPGEILFRYPLHPSATAVPNQKLGTVALAILGWIEWAKASGSHAEDDRIRAMARYTLSQLESNGRFEPYNVPPDHPYAGQVNDIVPGEAALALGLTSQYFGEREWIAFFPTFLDYYEPWFRDRASQRQRYGRWPAGTYENARRLELVQFGPWAVMASRQYYELTGDERAAAFGLEVADWMIDNYQWQGSRSPWPDYVGGYYKIPSELPAMQSFVYSEATASAYAIATSYQPDRKAKYDRATRETLRFMRVMQYDDVDSYFAPRTELIHGGIKYAMNHDKIRIDYVGHALSTLAQYLDARAADPDAGFSLSPVAAAGPSRTETAVLPPVGTDVDADPSASE